MRKIELEYLFELGYRYIARHENGIVEAFKEMPVRNKIANGSPDGDFGIWVVGEYPIKDHSKYHSLDLGKYEFVKWEDEPVVIYEIIENCLYFL